MTDQILYPPLLKSQDVPADAELQTFVARIDERVRRYLSDRLDNQDQRDHLRHVADRARWLYYSELQLQNPAASVTISYHDSILLDACVLTHDMGKWVPRDELRALFPLDREALSSSFRRLRFSPDQSELFLLGLRRRFSLTRDGYTPEYDAAHHLVSAYILVTDPAVSFHQLGPHDQERLINMIIGHQFGSYFKESLLNLSLKDREVTTGMLVDAARPERIMGDLLACVFHDADISDLLFVGSLERRPNREELFHTGGLVKIILINFANLIYGAPAAPQTLDDCLHSCQLTVHNVCKELITTTAIEYAFEWRKQAYRFMEQLRENAAYEKINTALMDTTHLPAERLTAVRLLTHMHARHFLKGANS